MAFEMTGLSVPLAETRDPIDGVLTLMKNIQGDRRRYYLMGSSGWVAGYIAFSTADAPVALLTSAELLPEHQGRGLGKFMYKEAINDLLQDGFRVFSMPGRSEMAERVWRSLLASSPESIQVTDDPYAGPGYTVLHPVSRRPDVRVRGHRRRA